MAQRAQPFPVKWVPKMALAHFCQSPFPLQLALLYTQAMGPKLKHKGKLFVFNRMEVFLLLLLMALLVAISFTAGVKMGQKLSYQAAGLVPQDRKAVQLKSWIEEDTHNLQESKDSQSQIEAVIVQDLKNKLEQISKAESPPQQTSAPPSPKEPPTTAPKQEVSYQGKWTIRLGSYQKMADAQHFADGFKVRGYSPIINEVSIEGRGVWYRVGLGIFDNMAAAKSYINQEQTLFQGQDYAIVQLR